MRLLAAVLCVALIVAAVLLQPPPTRSGTHYYYLEAAPGLVFAPDSQLPWTFWLPSAGAGALALVAGAYAARRR